MSSADGDCVLSEGWTMQAGRLDSTDLVRVSNGGTRLRHDIVTMTDQFEVSVFDQVTVSMGGRKKSNLSPIKPGSGLRPNETRYHYLERPLAPEPLN
jgi:hypothetical protein